MPPLPPVLPPRPPRHLLPPPPLSAQSRSKIETLLTNPPADLNVVIGRAGTEDEANDEARGQDKVPPELPNVVPA